MAQATIDAFWKTWRRTKAQLTSKCLCRYPMAAMLMHPNGEIRPCCKYDAPLRDENGNPLSTHTHSLEEIWQHPAYQALRSQLANGERAPGCWKCWQEDDQGIESMRWSSFDLFPRQVERQPPPFPSFLELFPGNVCNLKCRICTPLLSTKWIAEADDAGWNSYRTYNNLEDEQLEELVSKAGYLQNLAIMGGEPLLMPQALRLIERIAALPVAGNIKLRLSTNTTVYAPDFIRQVAAYQRTKLYLSMDDIGPRFAYQRKGANWETSVQHVQQFMADAEAYPHVHLIISCAVGILNAYYLPGFFEACAALFPGIPIEINLVHTPGAYNLAMLPHLAKQAIEQKLMAAEMPKQIRANYHDARTKVLKGMQAEATPSLDAFWQEVSRADLYRGESFAQVFPELDALLSAHATGPPHTANADKELS